MPCSLCRKCGHNKTTCPDNPNSKIAKKIDAKYKKLVFDRPQPLGTIHEIKHKDRHLGYVATPPPTKKKNPHKPFVITGKITRADIF